MAYEVGDPGHLSVHGALVTRLTSLGIVWEVALTLPDAPALGDTGHVPDHDLIVAAIRELHAAQVAAGALIDPLPALPDAALPGDLGHVDDHNLIEDALVVCEAGRKPYNVATGGTVTYYTDGEGQAWAVHSFTNPGADTFEVVESNAPFRVHVGGGNGGGICSGCCGGCGQRGRYGQHVQEDARTLAVGSYPVTVGGGGSGTGWSASGCGYGGNGGTSTFDGLSTPGGQNGVDGPIFETDIRGTTETLGSQGWNLGCGDHVTGSGGIAGIVVVAYEIDAIPADYVEDVDHPLPLPAENRELIPVGGPYE